MKILVDKPKLAGYVYKAIIAIVKGLIGLVMQNVDHRSIIHYSTQVNIMKNMSVNITDVYFGL